MRVTLLLIVACALVLAPAAALAKEKEDAAEVVAKKKGAELEAAIQEATQGTWWGAVLVAKDGEILLAKGYGEADYGKRACDANTLFEIASTSKQFTAAAILHLVQDGKLELETTLGEIFDAVPEDKRGITVHSLLTHTSGLSNRIGVAYNSPLRRAPYIAHILQAPLADEVVGETFAYNNAGYAILSAIVEEVSGTSFEAYSKKHLFDPAGMKHTGFIGDKRLKKRRNVAARTDDGEGTAVDWHWGFGYRGMGGVVTTVHDLLRWDRALRGDDVLGKEMRAVFYEPELESYACGWRVGVSPSGGTKVEHSGGVKGFTCQYERHLDDDVVITVLTNNEGEPFKIAEAIRRLMFPPVTMRAHLDVSPYDLPASRAAIFGDKAAWRVTARGAHRTLELVDDKGHVAASIEMPPSIVSRVKHELKHAIRARSADDAGEPAKMDAGVYLVNHRGGVVHDLSDGLSMRVMPSYNGGRRPQDRIATLVLEDATRRSWPVMVKMNVAASKELLEKLGG